MQRAGKNTANIRLSVPAYEGAQLTHYVRKILAGVVWLGGNGPQEFII